MPGSIVKVNEVLEGFIDIAASFLRSNIDEFLASNGLPANGINNHAAIEQALGAGVPCLDTTVRLEAKLSHAATPSVAVDDDGLTPDSNFVDLAGSGWEESSAGGDFVIRSTYNLPEPGSLWMLAAGVGFLAGAAFLCLACRGF